METLLVKITSCKEPLAWYADLIGEVFKVYDRGSDYVLCEDYDRGYSTLWRHINKDECLTVQQPKEQGDE